MDFLELGQIDMTNVVAKIESNKRQKIDSDVIQILRDKTDYGDALFTRQIGQYILRIISTHPREMLEIEIYDTSTNTRVLQQKYFPEHYAREMQTVFNYLDQQSEMWNSNKKTTEVKNKYYRISKKLYYFIEKVIGGLQERYYHLATY